jgi:hypothetical protein
VVQLLSKVAEQERLIAELRQGNARLTAADQAKWHGAGK